MKESSTKKELLARRVVEGPHGPVIIELDYPREDAIGDFYCHVDILGQKSRDVHLRGYGTDVLQALESSLVLINANLDTLD